MKPEPSPKTNASPVKMILWIVLGAAVVIWFILQRNTSQTPSAGPAARSNSSLSNDMSAGTSSYPSSDPPRLPSSKMNGSRDTPCWMLRMRWPWSKSSSSRFR